MFYCIFALLASGFSVSFAQEPPAVPPADLPGRVRPSISLVEDEFILPPFLVRFEGSRAMNVASLGKMHAVDAGEWLDRDGEFDLKDSQAVQVLMSEKIQWVGGGVLKLRIEEQQWARSPTPYRIFLNRGFLSVWVSGADGEQSMEVDTPQEKFIAQDASFWINVKSGVTELYLLKGSLRDSTGKIWDTQKYMSYKTGVAGTSSLWSTAAYKVHLSGLFPNLMKLIDHGESDWSGNRSQEAYAEMRKNGWRKKLRKER